MDCRTAANLVDKAIEGKLGIISRRRFEAHLGRCEPCRQERDRAQIRKAVSCGQPWDLSVVQQILPVLHVARTIVRYAIDMGATRVLLEPTASGASISYDVADGRQDTSHDIPGHAWKPLSECLLLLAGLEPGESQVPQSGEVLLHAEDGQNRRLLLATEKTEHGERIVLRMC